MPNMHPYVGAAFVCENVLQEKDGVASAIRMIDTVSVLAPPDLPPGAIPTIQLTLYVLLKSGDVSGTHPVAIKLRKPGGEVKDVGEWPIALHGGKHGASVSTHVTIAVREFGLYWFDVFWAGQAMTSVPLELVRAENTGKAG